MGKKDQGDGLDKDSRKRLERLDAQWNENVSIWNPSLSSADLRLLLEHHAPLQELIRSIAATSASRSQAATCEPMTMPARQVETEAGYAAVAEELARTQAELTQARNKCTALEKGLTECTATVEQLLQKNTELAKIRTQLEARVQQLQEELEHCQATLARNTSTPAELSLLRSDTELAQQMGLADLPADNMAALAQAVSVLAQRDNLERLWGILKERCEVQQRPVNQAEQALLSKTLSWYNHNWQSRPYRLIEATTGGAYDYEQHLRSRHTASGERLAALLLPGIADGSGRAFCKALVSTY